MSSNNFFAVALLDPLQGETPCGPNLRFTPEWRKILEAKRQDGIFDTGQWATQEQKIADWAVVEDLASNLLLTRSKDLRLSVLLVEAIIRRCGFKAMPESLQFLGKMMTQFWEGGLHPEPDGDSFEERADALLWLNTNLPDLLRNRPIAEDPVRGASFSFADFIDASTARKNGSNPELLTAYQETVSRTPRDFYVTLVSTLSHSQVELKAFRRLCEEKFGSPEAAPGMSEAAKTIEELLAHAETILSEKPASQESEVGTGEEGLRTANGLPMPFGSANGSSLGDWAKAEEMVHQGQVEKGLAEMIQLAQHEAGGRARFFRKLLLADIATKMNKDHLTQSILEELAEQIDSFKLIEWETSEVVGAVWTRLYRLYKRTGNEDRALQYYQRLCRLDPWQAFACSDR